MKETTWEQDREWDGYDKAIADMQLEHQAPKETDGTKVVYLIQDETSPTDKRYLLPSRGKESWTRSREYAQSYTTRRTAAAAIRRFGIGFATVSLLPVEVADYGLPSGHPLHIIRVIE